MPETLSALFELGNRPITGALNKARVIATILEPLVTTDITQHLLGIVLPVSSEMQVAAVFELIGQYINELGLNNTTFVVALFMPGIGEINLDTIQAFIRNAVLE